MASVCNVIVPVHAYFQTVRQISRQENKPLPYWKRRKFGFYVQGVPKAWAPISTHSELASLTHWLTVYLCAVLSSLPTTPVPSVCLRKDPAGEIIRISLLVSSLGPKGMGSMYWTVCFYWCHYWTRFIVLATYYLHFSFKVQEVGNLWPSRGSWSTLLIRPAYPGKLLR